MTAERPCPRPFFPAVKMNSFVKIGIGDTFENSLPILTFGRLKNHKPRFYKALRCFGDLDAPQGRQTPPAPGLDRARSDPFISRALSFLAPQTAARISAKEKYFPTSPRPNAASDKISRKNAQRVRIR